MPETPNHGYNVPSEGDENWHQPLDEDVEDFSDGADDYEVSYTIRGTRAGGEDEEVVREPATTPRTRRGATESPADD